MRFRVELPDGHSRGYVCENYGAAYRLPELGPIGSNFMVIGTVSFDQAEGFLPGGASLHNSWTAHGPDAERYERVSTMKLEPHKIENTMAFMFETRDLLRPTRFALEAAKLQHDYFECWQGLKKHFAGKP